MRLSNRRATNSRGARRAFSVAACLGFPSASRSLALKLVKRRYRFAAIVSTTLIATSSCSEHPATEVLVQLYVDSDLAPDAKKLHVTIENDEGKSVLNR